MGWIMFNLSVCYYLKYLSTASIADMATKIHNKDNNLDQPRPDEIEGTKSFLETEGYAIQSMIYHLGSFMGKSALSVYILARFEIISLALLAVVGVYAPCIYHKLIPFWYQLPIMWGIGLLSGIGYCSCMYWILYNKKLSKKNRELAIVMNSFTSELATFLATSSAIVAASIIAKMH